MQRRIAGGRYEPNGAVWVECDCNIPSGEALVRQFLWGQLYTQSRFGHLSDTFWLPDTFGYSAAIPQIMRGFGVKYFLTTKLAWNDTNDFPYDTFQWTGIDGSQVLTHFFVIDTWPDPAGSLSAWTASATVTACATNRLPIGASSPSVMEMAEVGRSLR